MVEMSILIFVLLVILVIALVVISFTTGLFMGMGAEQSKEIKARQDIINKMFSEEFKN